MKQGVNAELENFYKSLPAKLKPEFKSALKKHKEKNRNKNLSKKGRKSKMATKSFKDFCR